jgi:GNAT superfamily N-acetyltransferase
MSSLLHFRRQLLRPPDVVDVPGISVRNFVVSEDVDAFLVLRDRAMADQIPMVRTWSQNDLHVELLSKPWWSVERCWVVVAGDPVTRRSPAIGTNCSGGLVGSVTLALRQGVSRSVPVVHWLLVDPAWRRRGVGRLLLSYLELAAWNDGWRELELETHTKWESAVAFYQSMGYALVRDDAPR